MSDRTELIQQTEFDEDDDDDDDYQTQQQNKPKKKKKKKKNEKENNHNGFERKLKGAKKLVMLPFKKLEKACTRKKRRPPPPPFPYSEELGKSCHLCFVQPKVSFDSPLGSNPDAQTSSYQDFVRSFIERNDFYSPECNVHI